MVSLLDDNGEPTELLATFAGMPEAQRYLDLEARADVLDEADDVATELHELRTLAIFALKIVGPENGRMGVAGGAENRTKFGQYAWGYLKALQQKWSALEPSEAIERQKSEWQL